MDILKYKKIQRQIEDLASCYNQISKRDIITILFNGSVNIDTQEIISKCLSVYNVRGNQVYFKSPTIRKCLKCKKEFETFNPKNEHYCLKCKQSIESAYNYLSPKDYNSEVYEDMKKQALIKLHKKLEKNKNKIESAHK